MIAPAPRKPIPVTTWAAIRDGAKLILGSLVARNSLKPYAETTVKSAAPRQTSMCVRKPASRSRSSRSKPIVPPSTAASASLPRSSHQVIVGTTLSNDGLERGALGLGDLLDALARQVEQHVDQLPRARLAPARRLPLAHSSAADIHDVHVPLRARILLVVEVEERLAVDDADRDRRDRARQHLPEPEAVERATCRRVGAADRCAARAAV